MGNDEPLRIRVEDEDFNFVAVMPVDAGIYYCEVYYIKII